MMFRRHHTLRTTLQAAVLTGAAFLAAGCAMDRGDAVPQRATLRSEGTGDLVSYTTDTSGTGYVYDVSDNKLVWSGTLLSGQMITVDAKHDAILLDGRKVREQGIHQGHRYRIFVEPVVHD